MKKTKMINNKLRTLIFMMSFIISSVYLTFPLNTSISDENVLIDNDIREEPEVLPINDLKKSDIGEDPWWDENFEFRKLINITNPDSAPFNKLPFFYITFNYSELVDDGKMDADLRDVRIVENGVLSEYWIEKDNPVVGNATIWFSASCSGNEQKYDTYMYYGNITNVDYAHEKYMKYHPMGVAWYPFDGDANDYARDNDGTPLGAPSYVAGVKDQALSLNRADAESITIGNKPDFQITGNQTIMMWINAADLNVRQNPYAKAYGGEGTITLEPSGSLSYYYGQHGGNGSPYQGFGSGTATITSGVWNHIVLTRDLTNMQLYWYRNGTVRNTATATYSPAVAGTLSALIGRGYTNNFNGMIDDFRMFNASLSWAEIQRYYHFNYTIRGALMDEVEQGSRVFIEVRDLDGRPVSGALVCLVNATGDIVYNSTSEQDGVARFLRIPYESFNITVNYTLGNLEEVVYNSSAINNPVTFAIITERRTVYTNLWTIDFEVIDWDDHKMDYGYVVVFNDTNREVELANITLQKGLGRATFRWINKTNYYYDIYYRNEDYFQKDTLLNSSDVSRADMRRESEFKVNETNKNLPGASSFYVEEIISAEGANRIINATIDLKEMTDTLTSVQISYIDANDVWHVISEASKSYSVVTTEDTINLNIIDKYEAYGIKIQVQGTNSTRCNGIIDVKWRETSTHLVQANMSKMHIKVQDFASKIGAVGAIVKIRNASTGASIINLTTSSGELYGEKGYAYGLINKIEFWYLRGTYNISIDFGVGKNVVFNGTDQYYEHILSENSTIIFELEDADKYYTKFSAPKGDIEIGWGDNMAYEVNFSYTQDGGVSWAAVDNAQYVRCSVYNTNWDLLFYDDMIPRGNGNYTLEFNSSLFSAGYSSRSYVVEITGSVQGFSAPSPAYFFITISARESVITLYNYSAEHELLPDDTVAQYYNKLINITVSYNDTNPVTPFGLREAILSYSWTYGGESGITEDPLYPGFYTFTVNTSDSPNVGKYGIDITIQLENYSSESKRIFIDILTRPTMINGSTRLLHLSEPLWIKQAQNFTFEYNDTLSGVRLTELEEAYYYWYQLDSEGRPIGAPSENIELISVGDVYVLDFDTESRAVGDYAIFITLQKYNYEARNLFIDMRIRLRVMTPSLTATNFAESRITVVKGDSIEFSLTLTDFSRNAIPLTGATVTLTLDNGDVISFTEGDNGVYTASYSTANIDAFFTANTLIGTLKIEKADFVPISQEITIVVNMEEIFPGFPFFYFLMLVIGIAAVAGSLATYKAIQSAKIPKFVKKAERIKGAIKGRKSISESDLYPSKMHVILKKFGANWEKLGLSLEDILGLSSKKGKTLPEVKDQLKGGAVE